ncbi:hypothetical protein BVC80_1761g48 [Macleaya cordata]|uniref:Uncharacterized protein n=1 Tax=Macleaya cordata TaxID=56857 RepID=A0A200QTA0_MACCD|nr:hypothetical protein BVC80_1761g48 [Macleaya cordata]
MGDSSTRGREIADDEAFKATTTTTTTYLTSDNPCYCLEVAVRAFLKCLGLNSDPSSSSSEEEEEERNQTISTTLQDDPPTTRTETEKKATEDIILEANMRRRSNIKKPTRPSISTGRPGQTNSASS